MALHIPVFHFRPFTPTRTTRLSPYRTMKNVIAYIRSMYPISEDAVSALEACVTPCRFPKRYQLIRAGEYSRCAYFLEQGMTRSFWPVDGQEVTTSFSTEGGIVFSMDELYYGKPSEEVVETLEPVEVYFGGGFASAVGDQPGVVQLGSDSPPERVSAHSPKPPGAVDTAGPRTLRGFSATVSGGMSASQSKLYRFLSGHYALDAEPFAGCRKFFRRITEKIPPEVAGPHYHWGAPQWIRGCF